MTGFTTSTAEAILKEHFSHVYIALLSGEPADSATGYSGLEPATANGYKRKEMAMAITTGSSRQIQNTEELHYPIARNGGWGDLTHYAVCNALSGGSMIFADSFKEADGVTPKIITVPENSICAWDVGELIIGLDKKALDPANPTHA